jgi:hypothetical protein
MQAPDLHQPPTGHVDPETGQLIVLPGVALDSWLTCAWTDGVQIDSLDDLAVLRALTQNSTYVLAIMPGSGGEVLVRGGRYFPDWTPAQFLGCSLGGGLLKRHAVHIGLRMEFYRAGRRVVTSPVHTISHIAAVESAAPC